MKHLMKNMAVISVLICFLCIGAVTANAELPEYYFTNDAGTTVMHGGISLGVQQHKTDVTVSVYDENGGLNFRTVLNVGTDGNAEFSYINNGDDGDYTCYFAVRSLNVVETVVCEDFRGHEYWEAFVNDCNSYAQEEKKAELVNKVLTDKDVLNVDMELYDLLETPSNVGEIMLASYFNNYPQTTKFTLYTQPKDVVKAFEGAVYVAYINENPTKDAAKLIWNRDAQRDCLNLAQKMPTGKSGAVLDELSESTKNAVFTVVGNKVYKSVGALVEEFTDNTLFSAIKYADNYNDVQKVLSAYNKAEKIQISLGNNLTAYVSVFKNMQKKQYSSFGEVEDAFEQYWEDMKDNGKDSGSSGGSGGGGGFFKPAIKSEETKEDMYQDTMLNETAQTAPMYFNDIEDSKWALNAINYWYENGVISGNGYGGFEPTRNVSRSEMAKMLVGWRAYEHSDVVAPFSDIEPGAWYAPYVATAYAQGLFNGYEDGRFGVYDGITRQEAACVIYRLISTDGTIQKHKTEDFVFEDDRQIADWAKEAVYSLYKAGVISGRSEKKFVPDELMTRAEAVMLMYKAKIYLDL